MRESGTFDENRRAVGMLNPVRDKNGTHVPGEAKGQHLRPQFYLKLESKSETKQILCFQILVGYPSCVIHRPTSC